MTATTLECLQDDCKCRMLVDCEVPTGGKVLVKMGSDILSKWVGGTEENIRAAFAEAEAENVRNLTVQVLRKAGGGCIMTART